MIHFKDCYDGHIPNVPAFCPPAPPAPPCAPCPPPFQPQPCPPPMPKPMPCVPPAPSVCQGMDLYEAMNGLTDRVNTCIATYNDVMANSYQALRNLEKAAEANGAYYSECEVCTEQGYYADEGNTYCVTRKKVVDRHGEPIRMFLKLAYDNTTNSKLEQPIDDASMIECAQVIASCEVGENGWIGNCFYKGAPLPSIESGDGYCVAFTRNGTMRVYANAINQSQLLNDGVENSMSCVGRIIVDGEVKDEVATSVAPIVAMGQNTVTKEVFFVSAGSDANQVKQGLTARGLSSKACADILKGYGCDIAVVLSTEDNAMLLDKGENAFVPSKLPNPTKAKAFWYITRKAFYKNDYDRQLAELIQNYGQLRYTALLNQLSILNLKNYTEAEISRIDEQLMDFKERLEDFNARLNTLETNYNTLTNRVDTIKSDLTEVKKTINTLQQTVQNLIDIVNGMQNTIAKIQQTLTKMQNGTIKLPYIEKDSGIGTGTTKLENLTVSGDTVVSDLDVKTECWLPTPTQPLQGANKKYVDDSITAVLGSGEYLPLRGGTMTGNINMGQNEIQAIKRLNFDNDMGFSSTNSVGVVNTSIKFLRGLNYNAPIANNDFVQKKYVDDTVAAAVIEAAAGGLTETAANTKYLMLNGGNQPTVDEFDWQRTRLKATSFGIYGSNSEYNDTAISFEPVSNSGDIGEITYYPDGIEGAVSFQITGSPESHLIALKGRYKADENSDGFFVTDTYLKSATDLPFVKKSGDTMSGRLNMNSNAIYKASNVSFLFEESDDGSSDGNMYMQHNKENKYSVLCLCSNDSIVPNGEVIVRGVKDPAMKYDAVNLDYLNQHCEGKTQKVTLTGAVDVILADNTEYTIKNYTSISFVCDSEKKNENHGFITVPAVAIKPTLTGFAGIDGDDFTSCVANEIWEFSCFKGYLLFKNWGVKA